MRILIGFLCLFFLILFHEAGHFAAAKLFGVVVEAFSIGFGPVLLHKKIKDTDYRLSAIPLGGYCAMKGEKDFQKALESGLDYIPADKNSMYGVHPLKRLCIAFAGPFFNLIFAVIALTIINLTGYNYYSYSNKIIIPDEAQYPELESPAREAGIKSGDEIIRVNSATTEDFSDLIREISTRPGQTIELTVLRAGEELVFSVQSKMDKKTGAGKIGIMADTSTLEKKEKKPEWLFPALLHGTRETFKDSLLTVKGFATLFKGVDFKENVSGPARIADMMGQTVKESFADSIRSGIVNTLSLMAIISISLGIMNLLPIPVLDGGLILFAFIETVSRRKLSPKVLYYIQFVGIAFIVLMFVIGLNGDIQYFVNQIKRK